MREACSAGARGARGRGGGPWAEASLGVPAAAPRGHGLRAPGPGGTRAPLTAQRGWPPGGAARVSAQRSELIELIGAWPPRVAGSLCARLGPSGSRRAPAAAASTKERA